jgi:hypothetical protein
MSVVFTDEEIRALIVEPKTLPADYRSRFALRAKRGHKEQEFVVRGADEHEFHVILRQSTTDPLSFSVILGVTVPGTNRIFRLRRYNSQTHQHTNSLERTTIVFKPHMHLATARYQDVGTAEEAYAEPTDRFSTLSDAVDCMLRDCGFILPEGAQLPLFEERG